MTIIQRRTFSLQNILRGGSILAFILLAHSPVQALRFEPTDELTIDLDTTLAYGAMWRVEKQGENLDTVVPLSQMANSFSPGAVTYTDQVLRWNSDDGNRNFEKGDMVSNRVAVTSDFDMRHGNYGLFLRGQMFYDSVYFEENSWTPGVWENYRDIADIDCNADGFFDSVISAGGCGSTPHAYNGIGTYAGPESINNAVADGSISDPNHFSEDTKDRHGFDARFLDAYVYGTFPVGERTLDLRIGRQVISWGESIMLQGGIGFAQNRIDAAAATSPGVTLKEIFLPTGSVYAQLDLTDTWTVEAYWQYEFLPAELFGAGSYFNTTDMLSSDIMLNNINVGNCMFGLNKTYGGSANVDGVGGETPCDDSYPVNHNNLGASHTLNYSGTSFMSRSEDVLPDDETDQYGIAFRWLLEGGSEVGIYALQYHDRFPSFWAGNNGAKLGLVKPSTGNSVNNWDAVGLNTHRYTIEYAERRDLFGLTLNTVVSDIQMGFEVTYRPRQSVVPACTYEDLELGTTDASLDDQVNDPSFNYYRGLSFQSNCKDPAARFYAASGAYDYSSPDSGNNWSTGSDLILFGWPTDAEMFTYNMGVTLVVPPTPLWDTGILVAEFGGFEVGSGFENKDLKVTETVSFTQKGYGVSALFMPQYKNIIQGVDLTLPVFLNYGINGSFAYYNYTEGALWYSVGAEVIYLSNAMAGITYNSFHGSKNMWRDRDNIAFNVKYTF